MRIVSKLLIVLVLTGFHILGVSARTYLVSVGVSKYKDPSNNLKNAANDAKVIKWVFDQNGDATTVMLQNQEATFVNVRNTMSSVFSQAGSDDTIIFYFSGHGQGGSFQCYDGYLKYATILNVFAKSRACRKFVFADACYAGKIRDMHQERYNSKTRSKKKVNALFFLSSRSNETSGDVTYDHRDMNNSVFTAFLQRGLRGGADVNHDRAVSPLELFNFVRKGVVSLTHDRQHPVMWGSYDNEMPIIKW